jgi:hypothetical protein
MNEFSRVEAATVELHGDRRRGRGVLIPGGFILTAAHVAMNERDEPINWGGMSHGGQRHPPVTIRTPNGDEFKAGVEVVETVADIALLRPYESGRSFVESTISPPIVARRLRETVYFLNYEWVWVRAWIDAATAAGFAHVDAEAEVKSGCSGGPVVTAAGYLVGVVTGFFESPGRFGLALALAGFALPAWALSIIHAGGRR